MILPLSIQAEQTKTPQIIRLTTKDHLNGFPICVIGKESYIVSMQTENSVNLRPDYSYNLQIGNHCAIAHDVKVVVDIDHDYTNVCSGNLGLNVKFGKGGGRKRKGQILIQNDVWVGRGVSIMGGVTIHNGAVVAAGSVVTKDVAPYSIVGGNPARHIKYRFSQDIIEKLQKIRWWDWNEKIIQQNLSYFQGDINHFVDKFYTTAEDKIQKLQSLMLDVPRAEKQYLFFPDFDETFFIWKNVLLEFVKCFRHDETAGLLLFLPKNKKERLDDITKLLMDQDADCQIFVYFGDASEEKAIFQYADYYISNRTLRTVYHSCLADLFGLKMISGVDVPIFHTI